MSGYSRTFGINHNTELTERELEVLKLMAKGIFNKSIAEKLCISVHTVKAHATSIFRKLEVTNRIEAIMKGYELKLCGKNAEKK